MECSESGWPLGPSPSNIALLQNGDVHIMVRIYVCTYVHASVATRGFMACVYSVTRKNEGQCT